MKLISFRPFAEINPLIVGKILNEFPNGYEIQPVNYNSGNPIVVLKNVMKDIKIKEAEPHG